MASSKRARTPPPEGFQYVECHYWEATDVRRKLSQTSMRPVNGHKGIFAYHCDDCMCSLLGEWRCYRDGCIWSCCGSLERYSCCPIDGKKRVKKDEKKDVNKKPPWR